MVPEIEESLETQESKNTYTESRMRDVLDVMRRMKPADRTEEDRRYAVAITEMEKTLAYFSQFVTLKGR